MQILRIHFSKTGDAKYISHLDLIRCFTRAIKRSGIPVWYTQGYNSRLYLLFALPLALGIQSITEMVDIKVDDGGNDYFIVEKLNPLLPEGISPFNCSIPKFKHNEIASARYLLRINENDEYLSSFESILNELMSQPEIFIDKQGKKGESKIDIKGLIHKFYLYRNGNTIIVDITAAAGNDSSLNPMIVFNLITAKTGREPMNYSMTRTGINMKNGEVFE